MAVCHRYPSFYGIEYQSSGIKVLKGENINTWGEIQDVSEASFIDSATSERFPLTVVTEGDLIMSVRGEVGKVGYVTNVFARGNLNANTIRLSFKEKHRTDSITVRFIWMFLNSDIGKSIMRRAVAGGVQETITVPDILSVPVPLPDLSVRLYLVEKMEKARASRKQKLAQADALIDSLDGWLLEQLGLTLPPEKGRKVFVLRLVDVLKSGRIDSLYHLPKYQGISTSLEKGPFPIRTLQMICEAPVGGATPKKGDAELYAEEGEGVHFLRILNVKPNELNLTDVKYISEAVHNGELARSQLGTNDVLMTITGRVGTAAVVTEEVLPANINQHIVRLRVKDNHCLPDYLSAYLNSSVGLTISNRNVTGGTRIALDYTAIRSLPVPIPPREIQQVIINEIHRRREEARRLRTEAEAEWQAAKAHFEAQLLGEAR